MKEAIIVFVVAMCVSSFFNGLSFTSPTDEAPTSPQTQISQPSGDQPAPQIGSHSSFSKSGPQPNGSGM
ncbi:MAG TPA: hypothetical protein V6C81_30455 [Planktothrix sp.]|jgi:hypothetical protein